MRGLLEQLPPEKTVRATSPMRWQGNIPHEMTGQYPAWDDRAVSPMRWQGNIPHEMTGQYPPWDDRAISRMRWQGNIPHEMTGQHPPWDDRAISRMRRLLGQHPYERPVRCVLGQCPHEVTGQHPHERPVRATSPTRLQGNIPMRGLLGQHPPWDDRAISPMRGLLEQHPHERPVRATSPMRWQGNIPPWEAC